MPGQVFMEETSNKSVLSRRKALTRLGLAVAVVYAAPTITHIDAEAKRRRRARPSNVCPGGSCSGGKGKGGGKSKGGGGKSKGGGGKGKGKG
jgi:hypothetical protein